MHVGRQQKKNHIKEQRNYVRCSDKIIQTKILTYIGKNPAVKIEKKLLNRST